MEKKRQYSLTSRALYRGKMFLERINKSWSGYLRYRMSRDEAKKIRERVITRNGQQIVDQKMIKTIKTYCRDVFDSPAYWPWLALYTELRGEFKEGWIPDEYYRFKLLPKMNPEKYMRFSEAKALDHKIFNSSIVKSIVVRANGLYFDEEGRFKTKNEALQILRDQPGEIIIKPVSGRSGNEIMFKDPQEIDLQELSPGADLVFQNVVKQHPEMSSLYPHSVNTFRVMSYLTQDGEIKIKFIIIRFGIGGNRVDNASQGGNWIFVYPDGTVSPKAYEGNGIPANNRHPDTGTRYADLNLPFIPKITAFCRDAHCHFPYTRIIGWDVFVDAEGEPKLIEWNANNPFFWAIEARFGPIFDEPECMNL
ncbi:sugar-transfer associated ATP-grasp domain-containing protein [Halalkalibaculum sp. DA384]|uniref:sugar-transfer associated ATP-grasp domain-containing protein n=1 Tax=Halalkalibaculum sp. DA384 TaxID=3373606 RepID=UPI003754EA73